MFCNTRFNILEIKLIPNSGFLGNEANLAHMSDYMMALIDDVDGSWKGPREKSRPLKLCWIKALLLQLLQKSVTSLCPISFVSCSVHKLIRWGFGLWSQMTDVELISLQSFLIWHQRWQHIIFLFDSSIMLVWRSFMVDV